MSKLGKYYNKDQLEACLDEAGMGSLAGPVVATAVIWPQEFEDEDCFELRILNDSKKLTPRRRLMLKDFIEYHAIDHQTEFIGADVIDDINIYHARFLAMHNAIKNLRVAPDSLLVDGDKFTPYPYEKLPFKCVIGGDGKYQGIAAASILAKVARDKYMEELNEKFPKYEWNSNKGYGSKGHYEKINEFGPSLHHRRSFNLNIHNTRYI